ncbi:MAG TPA: hypothetical protein VFU72_09235 [Nitrolancea sp.]|nr:hypothetical protein [Nitrolancea sp.]
MNWGTAVAPTWFHKWLDGTKEMPQVRLQNEMEGDVTQTETLTYKQAQFRQFTIIEYARPVIAGYALQSLLGTNSDTLTAAAKSSTLSAPITAGATSFTSVGDLGNVGPSQAVGFSTAYGDTSYEVATVDLTTRTGAGPWVYTLAASGTFKKAHLASDPIAFPSTHAFSESAVFTYDPYSYEFGYGVSGGTPNRVLRVKDAVCYGLRIRADAGKPVIFEHDWFGAMASVQAAFTAVVQDSGPPLLFYQGAGAWKLNALTTGNAATIKQLSVELKRNTAAEDLINENLTPAYFLPGALTAGGSLTVDFSSWQEYDQAYYGKAAAQTADTDSFIVGTEALETTITADGVNSFKVSLPTINFAAATLEPKLDSKPLDQQIQFTAIRPPAQAKLLTITVTNNQNTAY